MVSYEFLALLILGGVAFVFLALKENKQSAPSYRIRVFVRVELCEENDPDTINKVERFDWHSKLPTPPEVGMRLVFHDAFADVSSVGVDVYGFDVVCTKKVFDLDSFEEASEDFRAVETFGDLK